MQEFLEIFLRREGYDVITAGDVDTALVHLESDEIDLVITDHPDAGKDGAGADPGRTRDLSRHDR